MKDKMVPFCDVVLEPKEIHYEFWKYDNLDDIESYHEGQFYFTVARLLTTGWLRQQMYVDGRVLLK